MLFFIVRVWFLPSVPDETIERVEGDQVKIVAQAEDTNPTEEWVYTYLMLEVTGQEPHLDTVVSTLAANGWTIQGTDPDPDNPPSAVIPDVAYLTLVSFENYMDGLPSSRVAGEAFEKVPTSDDKGYFVAILTPLSG